MAYLAESSTNVRFGSKADIPRHSHLCPLSEVKQTFNVRFQGAMQFSGFNVRFRGQSGRPTHNPKESAYGQKRTFGNRPQ